MEPAARSAADTIAEPMTVEPSSNCTMLFKAAPPLARDTVNLGCVREVRLSVDEIPVSSATSRSGTPGADCAEASIVKVKVVDDGPTIDVFEIACALSRYSPLASAGVIAKST